MDDITREHVNNLRIDDANKRYASFQYLIQSTNEPVAWAYDAWDELLTLMRKGDGHQRTIAVQLISNLAKSDTESRLLNDFDKLIVVTKDEKFVTARHSLQSLWKIAVVNETFKNMVVKQLIKRFSECSEEKNSTLVRYDILEVIKKIYDKVRDERLQHTAKELINLEEDPKYRKKYSGLWKGSSLNAAGAKK